VALPEAWGGGSFGPINCKPHCGLPCSPAPQGPWQPAGVMRDRGGRAWLADGTLHPRTEGSVTLAGVITRSQYVEELNTSPGQSPSAHARGCLLAEILTVVGNVQTRA
jgi:hypothetical protein